MLAAQLPSEPSPLKRAFSKGRGSATMFQSVSAADILEAGGGVEDLMEGFCHGVDVRAVDLQKAGATPAEMISASKRGVLILSRHLLEVGADASCILRAKGNGIVVSSADLVKARASVADLLKARRIGMTVTASDMKTAGADFAKLLELAPSGRVHLSDADVIGCSSEQKADLVRRGALVQDPSILCAMKDSAELMQKALENGSRVTVDDLKRAGVAEETRAQLASKYSLDGWDERPSKLCKLEADPLPEAEGCRGGEKEAGLGGDGNAESVGKDGGESTGQEKKDGDRHDAEDGDSAKPQMHAGVCEDTADGADDGNCEDSLDG
nr:hypothetical protein TetV2_00095 [Oceanusvirus sp.]